MHRSIRLAVFAVAVMSVVPSYAGSCEPPILNAALDTLTKANRSGALGRVLVAKNTSGEIRASLVEFALKLHPKDVAAEMLSDFQRRNASPVDASANGPDLTKYRQGDVLDWDALRRDFPDTETVAELSRPGCDSTGAHGFIRLRYHFHTPQKRPDGNLIHFAKQEDGTWAQGRVTGSSQARWVRVDCATEGIPATPDYVELCESFAKPVTTQAAGH
ncbi:MAG TPA: hypothetical protein VJZ00_00660 [Thermoanaerobaculia bacterium]|nr:hypothetical protein [Thermoanaerobaculia bacterium]